MTSGLFVRFLIFLLHVVGSRQLVRRMSVVVVVFSLELVCTHNFEKRALTTSGAAFSIQLVMSFPNACVLHHLQTIP